MSARFLFPALALAALPLGVASAEVPAGPAHVSPDGSVTVQMPCANPRSMEPEGFPSEVLVCWESEALYLYTFRVDPDGAGAFERVLSEMADNAFTQVEEGTLGGKRVAVATQASVDGGGMVRVIEIAPDTVAFAAVGRPQLTWASNDDARKASAFVNSLKVVD
ncbi:hypothetical protein VCJ71_01885 [Alteriqipengyuania sp. WL0013]|uniref:hypothetical protein n=1 Tax=Alteriqipengyuania sp. WL0013 TaxID=3110773 RepID=UPI002BD147CC|nr:hypothetical protein [Alteriqipengyuania sp. WL0013]MEB3414809.1 hypothetical protein [Alteriqipengyuania sp. WL0013]